MGPADSERTGSTPWQTSVVTDESGDEVESVEPMPSRRRRFRRFRWRRQTTREIAPVDLVQMHERDRAFRERLLNNAPPLISGAVFAYVVMKVVLIAHANPTTSLALISRAGLLQVVAGVAVVGIPFLGTGLTNVAGFLARDRTLNRYERRRLWVYFGIGVFWISFVVPIFTMVLVLIFALVNLLLYREKPAPEKGDSKFDMDAFLAAPPEDVVLREHWDELKRIHNARQDERAKDTPDQNALESLREEYRTTAELYNERLLLIQEKARPRLDALAASLLLTSLLPMVQMTLDDTPWMPAEDIRMDNGDHVTAYVLGHEEGWTALLAEDSRLVRMVETDDIAERKVCATANVGGRPQRTLYRLFAHSDPVYPRCVGAAKDAAQPRVSPTATPTPTPSSSPTSSRPRPLRPKPAVSSTPTPGVVIIP